MPAMRTTGNGPAELVSGVKFENLVLTAMTGNPASSARPRASFARFVNASKGAVVGVASCNTVDP